ncbi:MAG: hypothetical protein IH624_20440 [Phycisphaerae bacterium]|nr:hypothetical protein [Phycisphaerae bacterium]
MNAPMGGHNRRGGILVLVVGIGVILATLGLGLLHLAYSCHVLVLRTNQAIIARCAADSGPVIAVWDMNEDLLRGTWSSPPGPRTVEMGGSKATCTYTVTGAWPTYVIDSVGVCGGATRVVHARVKAESFWKGIGVTDAIIINNNGIIASTGQEIAIRTNSGDKDKICLRYGARVPGDVIYGPTGSALWTIENRRNADIYGETYAGEEIAYPPAAQPEIGLTDTYKLDVSTWTAYNDCGGDTVGASDGITNFSGADPMGALATPRPIRITWQGAGLAEGPGATASLTTPPGDSGVEFADVINWLGDTEAAADFIMHLTGPGITPYCRYALSCGAIRDPGSSGSMFTIMNVLKYTQESSDGAALTENTTEISDYNPTGKVAKWAGIQPGWDAVDETNRISLRVTALSGTAHLSCFKLVRENRAFLGEPGARTQYRFPRAEITGTLCIEGHVTLYCDAQDTADYMAPSNDCFVLNAGASLLMKSGASLELYLGGDMDVKNGSTVICEDSAANQFAIFGLPYAPHTGKGCKNINLLNSGDLCAAVYAPDTAVQVGNDGKFLGAVVAHSLDLKNTGDFVYDASLADDIEEGHPARFTLHRWWED